MQIDTAFGSPAPEQGVVASKIITPADLLCAAGAQSPRVGEVGESAGVQIDIAFGSPAPEQGV